MTGSVRQTLFSRPDRIVVVTCSCVVRTCVIRPSLKSAWSVSNRTPLGTLCMQAIIRSRPPKSVCLESADCTWRGRPTSGRHRAIRRACRLCSPTAGCQHVIKRVHFRNPYLPEVASMTMIVSIWQRGRQVVWGHTGSRRNLYAMGLRWGETVASAPDMAWPRRASVTSLSMSSPLL